MQKRTREILALVLLIVLGIGVICAMGWYILVGHNWNVAATNIDDSIGQMRGYTVFLVKGNKPVPPSPDETIASTDATDASNAENVDAVDVTGQDRVSDADVVASFQPNSFPVANVVNDATEASTVENAEGETIRTVIELIEEYQDKGAEVYVIESANVDAYGSPVIIEGSSQTIGVFKIGDPARPAAVRVETKMLNRVNTDFNILVTGDASLEGSNLKDVGIIVFNPSEGEYSNGRYGGNSYCVDTPYEGQVEAIIVSPSGVISSKVISL